MPTASGQHSLAVPADESDSQRHPGIRMPRRRLWLAACAAGAVGLVAGAVPAIALSGTAPVVFHACVTNKMGAIRIVSASTHCATGQHKIFWNQTGPRSEEHTSELQSRRDVVCRLLLEKKKMNFFSRSRRKTNKRKSKHSDMLRNK